MSIRPPRAPQHLQAQINDRRVGQLVGLRFASDGELPDLVRMALKEDLKQGDIKKAIKQWVPDLTRV